MKQCNLRPLAIGWQLRDRVSGCNFRQRVPHAQDGGAEATN